MCGPEEIKFLDTVGYNITGRVAICTDHQVVVVVKLMAKAATVAAATATAAAAAATLVAAATARTAAMMMRMMMTTTTTTTTIEFSPFLVHTLLSCLPINTRLSRLQPLCTHSIIFPLPYLELTLSICIPEFLMCSLFVKLTNFVCGNSISYLTILSTTV